MQEEAGAAAAAHAASQAIKQGSFWPHAIPQQGIPRQEAGGSKLGQMQRGMEQKVEGSIRANWAPNIAEMSGGRFEIHCCSRSPLL